MWLAYLNMWVSTGNVGSLKATARTTLAVLWPTPASSSRSGKLSGTSPLCFSTNFCSTIGMSLIIIWSRFLSRFLPSNTEPEGEILHCCQSSPACQSMMCHELSRYLIQTEVSVLVSIQARHDKTKQILASLCFEAIAQASAACPGKKSMCGPDTGFKPWNGVTASPFVSKSGWEVLQFMCAMRKIVPDSSAWYSLLWWVPSQSDVCDPQSPSPAQTSLL